MNKKILCGITTLLLLWSCGDHHANTSWGTVEISIHKMKSLDYSDFPGGVFSALDIVVLDSGDDYLISQIDKAVCRDGEIYLLDWAQRKIFTYDMEGKALSVLSKNGRGPGEYLQVTDFDVDQNGNVWILDGQKDCLLEYGQDGLRSIRASKYDLQMLRCLDNDSFLFLLAPWDNSRYSGKELLLSDYDFNIEKAFIEYGDSVDPDYQLPSLGFADNGTDIFYHQPIDDEVYRINSSGDIDSIYRFDFGGRTVPDKARKNIERHLEDFAGYTTLAKTVYVLPDFIVGSLYQGRALKDFIMDRTSGRVYVQNEEYQYLRLVGISDAKAVFWVVPGCELPDSFPAEYRAKYEAGHEILAIMDLDKLPLKFK